MAKDFEWRAEIETSSSALCMCVFVRVGACLCALACVFLRVRVCVCVSACV